jgi:hypothetical protein
MPMRGELPIPSRFAVGRIVPAKTLKDDVVGIVNDPDFNLIVGFAAAVLLVSVCLIVFLPLPYDALALLTQVP